MRTAPNKKRGYVILPVVIPAGTTPSEALNDNKTYKVVWEVLQALRSHDDRFDAMINKLDLIGKDNSKMEVIAITDKVQKKASKASGATNSAAGKGSYGIGSVEKKPEQTSMDLKFEVSDVERALYAKVVKKCGNRSHWEDWANDIAKIANTHITRISTIVNDPNNAKEAKLFKSFADELRDDLNEAITDDEVIEMLAQHLITKPVFDALFEEYSFASNNPVSLAMQNVLDVLHEHRLEKEADTLEKFYASVRLRAEGIDNAEGKQKIVVELYDKFFRNAFPRMTERLGIVYTPVEVVDFIIHSINDVLQSEFDLTLGSKGVHILDPFTGTGTFITRLLQSGLISKEQLPHKYKHEIHANEIVLLAYYIAAINIEAVYHSLVGGDYQPFEGICLTDTFQLYEKDDLISHHLVDNSDRRQRQKELDIRVIMGNPPYSAGQTSANDNNANVHYEQLDRSIEITYAKYSQATLNKGLYDSYIRAIRWASDRLGNSGIMSFVSNASFVDSNTTDGLRKCLADEFSSIYIFHLRGNARTQGELRRKEKDNVFGQGTRTPIAISLLVKNPNVREHGKIYFHDIGDYLSQKDKLEKISEYKSISGISETDGWQRIEPDQHHDWINQRDDSFDNFIKMGDKKDKSSLALFNTYSLGVSTNRDAWVYNFSKPQLCNNLEKTIKFYNLERERYLASEPKSKGLKEVGDFVDSNSANISWTVNFKKLLLNNKELRLKGESLRIGVYRPFTKYWLYFENDLIERPGLVRNIYPKEASINRAIYISGKGASKGFSALISDAIPNLHNLDSGQCFPLKVHEKSNERHAKVQDDLFSNSNETTEGEYTIKDGLTDEGLAYFQQAYPSETITKEDVFYYIYGLLHSEEYKSRYADNLTKELPRIPCVKAAKDFWAFSQAGRDLAELHINYETVDCYPVTLEADEPLDDKAYYVTKMKFAKKKEDGKSVNDKSTVIYNHHITIKDIPLEAYDYIVNGKPALEWVMERQAVTTDKKSGIVNDANLWATETMGNAKYPLELFQRVITVSIETMKIVKSLSKLDID